MSSPRRQAVKTKEKIQAGLIPFQGSYYMLITEAGAPEV
jgi:hypothetical protein